MSLCMGALFTLVHLLIGYIIEIDGVLLYSVKSQVYMSLLIIAASAFYVIVAEYDQIGLPIALLLICIAVISGLGALALLKRIPKISGDEMLEKR